MNEFNSSINHPASIYIVSNYTNIVHTNIDLLHPAAFQILSINNLYEKNKHMYKILLRNLDTKIIDPDDQY